MHWVRANLRFAAWCALFALALQFALTFGHVHVPGLKKGLLLSQLIVPSSAAVADAPAKPAKPAKPIAHDQCAVCASIQLASSVIPAAAPSFLLHASPPRSRLGFDIARVLAAAPHNFFQARGPPYA
jgi:hypothetical protein